ncbi:MAG: outer membrane beta-barrel protein [Gammaproteobacteria bacterium]|nr:outer membrane beta-barrel protein [Gammaproteobacteria bacterium]
MKFKAALLAAIAVLFSNVAAAGSYYVTAEKTEYKLTTYTTTTSNSSDGDGNQVRFGFQANENFAVEFLYGLDDDLQAGLNTAGQTREGESYYGILLRPGTQIKSWLRVNATFGIVRGELFEGSDSFSWGVGIEFMPSSVFSIIGGWTHLAEEDEGSTGLRVEGLNVGVKFRFGGEDD